MTKGRILATGLSTQHVGRNTRYGYTSVARLFVDALRHYGYEVEHRPTIPDEDLTGYDAVFSGLSPVNALSARYCYGGLDAISRARSSGCALMFYIDDWQTQLLRTASRTIVKKPERLIRPVLIQARIVDQFHWAHDPAVLERLTAVCDAIAEREWPTTLMALYDGGDWGKFGEKVQTSKLIGADPTPFYPDYEIERVPDAERWGAWVFGVLSDQRKWMDGLNLQWPLAHRGGRASKADDGGMKEHELVQMYAKSWGVLSCPYWHAGSGWFRIRHDQAASMGAVLVSESDELTFIDPSYGVKANEVEGLPVPQLRELADAQSKAWYARKPTKDEVADRIGKAMDEEIAAMKS